MATRLMDPEQEWLPLVQPTDTEVALEKQWRANELAQAEYWGPDATVIYWWAGGSWDREGWDALPEYERRRWRGQFETARDRADATGSRMVTAAHCAAQAEEDYQRNKAHAELWAHDIREAFKTRKPCPIIPDPAYEWLLNWAFQIAQVPQECVARVEPTAPRGTTATAIPRP